MQRYKLKPGHEFRGFRVRLYPTLEQVEWLRGQQQALRLIWNWLVNQGRDHAEAVEAFAIREQLVPARPAAPVYEGLTPEDAKARKQEHRDAVRAWYGEVKSQTKGLAVCKYRKFKEMLEQFNCKHDYQLLHKVLQWKTGYVAPPVQPGAHLLQALTKNFFAPSKYPKRVKKSDREMPVQVRSGKCFMLGDYGSRGRTHSQVCDGWFNCQIAIGKFKVRGRLPGRVPPGRVLEGVSIIEEADGWYASFTVEVPKRDLPPPVIGTVVGIDVGLDNIVAISNQAEPVPNNRDIYFNEKIASLQRWATITDDECERVMYMQRAARLHQKARRHIKHVIYNAVLKPLELVETIKIEKISPRLGQMGSRKLSVMRLVQNLLVERYGDRVREVDCAYTSQDCSQCGHRSAESWSYDHGPTGLCPACGYTAHRDINAARNIAARPALSLE